jgi:hypothetical protein
MCAGWYAGTIYQITTLWYEKATWKKLTDTELEGYPLY